MTTSDDVQKRNAFAACAAFRIEGLEASLDQAREIAVRDELAAGTTLRKRKDTWLKFASCIKRRWMSSAERRENEALAPPCRL